jgi:hypothetical protein
MVRRVPDQRATTTFMGDCNTKKTQYSFIVISLTRVINFNSLGYVEWL